MTHSKKTHHLGRYLRSITVPCHAIKWLWREKLRFHATNCAVISVFEASKTCEIYFVRASSCVKGNLLQYKNMCHSSLIETVQVAWTPKNRTFLGSFSRSSFSKLDFVWPLLHFPHSIVEPHLDIQIDPICLLSVCRSAPKNSKKKRTCFELKETISWHPTRSICVFDDHVEF